MDNYTVYFEYYSSGESGSDKFRFDDKQSALDKMQECRNAIRENFGFDDSLEVIDEPDFFGIMDHASGDYAKVILA